MQQTRTSQGTFYAELRHKSELLARMAVRMPVLVRRVGGLEANMHYEGYFEVAVKRKT
jgi:hypothetical protein